jgi:DNA-binding response OmpR family regulator
MHILLVEDDAKLGLLIQYKLNKELHRAEWAKDAEEAEDYLLAGSFDLYILDWMLPGKSGVEFCRERRKSGDSTPILLLTARDAVNDRVYGLNEGADDYLLKPFAFEELQARIKALARRVESGWTGGIISFDDVLILNTSTREVARSGQPVSLTRREYQLLAYLLRNQGKVVTRERFMDSVWGMDAEVTPNAVDAAIRLLRKKIDDPFPDKLIKNVRGLGYRLSRED